MTFQIDGNCLRKLDAVYFYQIVIRLIDKAMKKLDTSVRGNMAVEIHKHLHLCQESAKKFLGREDELNKVGISVYRVFQTGDLCTVVRFIKHCFLFSVSQPWKE